MSIDKQLIRHLLNIGCVRLLRNAYPDLEVDAVIDDILAEEEYAKLRERMWREGIPTPRERRELFKDTDSYREWEASKGRIEEDIEKAREVTMQEYLGTSETYVVCPFHPERTPSLHLTESRFYCFGCNKKGDTIHYVMETEGVPFLRAVKVLTSLK